MIATIDGGGRILVPKGLREKLGLTPGTRVELIEADGRLEISPAATQMRLEQRGDDVVAVADRAMPVLTADLVRTVVEDQCR
jgi:AbrB family looped-hinge helix DNA binding protein